MLLLTKTMLLLVTICLLENVLEFKGAKFDNLCMLFPVVRDSS